MQSSEVHHTALTKDTDPKSCS